MPRTEIVKSFHFEAAHHLRGFPERHPYSRLHGHSFRVEVGIAGTPDAATGLIMDFALIDKALAELRAQLDHGYLNDIGGLEQPTLENIAAWVGARLKPSLPGLSRVSVYRDTIGEACHLTF